MTIPRGADVEIIGDLADNFILFPTRVMVNGVDVGLIAENGVTIHTGGADEPTRVVLVLLPRHVEVKNPAPGEPA